MKSKFISLCVVVIASVILFSCNNVFSSDNESNCTVTFDGNGGKAQLDKIEVKSGSITVYAQWDNAY